MAVGLAWLTTSVSESTLPGSGQARAAKLAVRGQRARTAEVGLAGLAAKIVSSRHIQRNYAAGSNSDNRFFR